MGILTISPDVKPGSSILINQNRDINKMINTNQNKIAGAIIIAGVLIAGAVLLRGSLPPRVAQDGQNLADIKIRPVSGDDHILGNPEAKIMIVEYSDTECPFCKVFHNTMHQVVEKNNGKVAWVYRHFPIAGLHPIAFHEAEAMECAGEQGDKYTFWKYTDLLFERTESNNRLDPAELPKMASEIGLDLSVFNKCLEGGKYKDKVQSDIDDGNQAGVNGTPHSFILVKGKIVDVIQGAEPLEAIMQKIEKLK